MKLVFQRNPFGETVPGQTPQSWEYPEDIIYGKHGRAAYNGRNI